MKHLAFSSQVFSNLFSTQTTFLNRYLLIILLWFISASALFAQAAFIANGKEHAVGFTGTYQDFKIPEFTYIQKISFKITGGSGGVARTSDHPFNNASAGSTAAGQGATLHCTYLVGNGPNQIKPGSVVRFIIGGHGKSLEDAIQFQAAGGGGGASAVLVKQPGEAQFTQIMIAGGGGGAARGHDIEEEGDTWRAYLEESTGKGGAITQFGSDGWGTDSGSGGENGQGGGSGDHPGINNFNVSCGGGGFYSGGSDNDCGQGSGNKALAQGNVGGNGNCVLTTFIPGGYGYGSGGAGIIQSNILFDPYVSGGGGGGWSGGGGGGVWWQGGGGGGSFIDYVTFAIDPGSSSITDGWLAHANEHGAGSYECHLPPVEISCKNFIVDLSNTAYYALKPEDVLGDHKVGVVYTSVTDMAIFCSNVGQSTVVTLTGTGIAGNSASCFAAVTVVDNSIPVITCPQDTVVFNTPNVCGTHVQYNTWYTASDNCYPQVSLVSGLGNAAFFPIGTTNIVLKATDNGFNSATCSFNITVKDNEKPKAFCPANITKDNDPGFCGAVVSFNATGDDNCDNPLVLQSFGLSSNAQFPIGVSTVEFKVSDFSGNFTTCSFTVTVLDKEKPTVFCKPFTANLSPQGEWTLLTLDVYEIGYDNCNDINLQSVTPNQFTCANLGENQVTLTINDGHGNTATCNAIVTVKDVIAPTMLCKNVTINLNHAGQATLTIDQVNNESHDNCGIANLVLGQSTFTCANLGSNSVSLSGNDESGNTATCNATVTVKDVIAPTMLCKNATISLNAAGQATLTIDQVNNGSYDNCGIANLVLGQSTFTCANLGTNSVTLGGNDGSGNKSVCVATVTVLDPIKPVAKCKHITTNLGPNGSITLANSAVNNGSFDNCSFTMELTPNTFNCVNVGANAAVLTATDASGNTATCNATITVKDLTPPTALCKNTTIYVNDAGQATLSSSEINNGSSDACGIATMSISKTLFNCSDISGASQTVTLTLKDVNNNSASCKAQVTIKDNLAPTALCENTTVELGSNGTVTVYPQELAQDSYDNCSVWSYSPTAKVYTTANIGDNNLTITVKDWSGNAATCLSVVTVQAYNNSGGSGNRGTEELQTAKVNLTVFPNPTEGETSMQFALPTEQAFSIRVFDMSGRLVLSHEGQGLEGENNFLLNLRGIAAGVYVLDFQSGGWKGQKRLMVQE